MRSRSSCVFQAEPDGAAFAEQPLRNRAIGFAGEVCIERAKGERQSAASRRREVIGGAVNRLRSGDPPQAQRSVRTGVEILIEWDAAAGVAVVAPAMSPTGVRSSRTRYSPSLAAPRNRSRWAAMLRASRSSSGAGARRTTAGARCVSQIGGVLSGRPSESKGKF